MLYRKGKLEVTLRKDNNTDNIIKTDEIGRKSSLVYSSSIIKSHQNI